MKATFTPSRMVWIDLEMTGLSPERNVILEIATIITEPDLTIVAEGPAIPVTASENDLRAMTDEVRSLHEQSGLILAVQSAKRSVEQAQKETLNFVKKYCEPQAAVLAGNSVWADKMFLRRYMPDLNAYLHYRLVDVSSVKLLVRSWYPDSTHLEFKKAENHRALDDIRESIAELKHYKKHFFKSL